MIEHVDRMAGSHSYRAILSLWDLEMEEADSVMLVETSVTY